MDVSEKGLAFVAAREACVLTAYRDATMLAIGFGQNSPILKEGDAITQERAVEMFVAAAKAFSASLNKTFAGVSLEQRHFDSLFALAYNIGGTGLARQTALVDAVKTHRADPLNAALRDEVGHQIVSYPANFSRRCREALLYVTGDYGDLSTLKLWPAGKSPKHTPPDPVTIVPMPTFLGAKT